MVEWCGLMVDNVQWWWANNGLWIMVVVYSNGRSGCWLDLHVVSHSYLNIVITPCELVSLPSLTFLTDHSSQFDMVPSRPMITRVSGLVVKRWWVVVAGFAAVGFAAKFHEWLRWRQMGALAGANRGESSLMVTIFGAVSSASRSISTAHIMAVLQKTYRFCS